MQGYGVGYDCYWFRGKWRSWTEKYSTFRDFRQAVALGWHPQKK